MTQRHALVARVITMLRSEIGSGRWPVGTKLPVEAELAAEYEISRATLRQAVQALVHVGLLQTIQGNGTFVRADHEVGPVLTRYLAAEEDIAVLEVRESIEATAAALAAQRATDEEISAMEALLQQAENALAGDDLDATNTYSIDFHVAVVAAAGNPVLQHLYEAIQAATARTVDNWMSAQPAERFQSQHREILAAIRRRAPEQARAASIDHLAPVLGAARAANGLPDSTPTDDERPRGSAS